MDENTLKNIPSSYREVVGKIGDRCEKANIETEVETSSDVEVNYFFVKLPSGRYKRTLYITDKDEASRLNGIAFEKYVFVEGYDGICCYKDGTIEVLIRTLSEIMPEILIGRLLNIGFKEIKKIKREELKFEVKGDVAGGKSVSVSIGFPTKELLILGELEFIFPAEEAVKRLTIKIKGVKINNNIEAVVVLEKLANAFFFGINTSLKIAMMLDVNVEPVKLKTANIVRFGKRRKKRIPLHFPTYEYDTEPINLYWYANSARGMPLLKFLAYYQVLEYYFPFYAGKEVQMGMANILKEPSFDPNSSQDINRITSIVLLKMKGGYGEEKAQLRATIKGCVNDKEVVNVLGEEHIIEYFGEEYKRISIVRINLKNKDVGIRDQLADRIYDIRCKIVHTKESEEEKGRILPFTKQESLLYIENEIMEFLASKALIANSRKIDISNAGITRNQ